MKDDPVIQGFTPLENASRLTAGSGSSMTSAGSNARASSLTGFTLIEVIVSIAVIMMMLSIFLSFNARSRETVALLSEKAKIGQMILHAKSFSILAGKEPSPPPYFCGYGIHFDYAAQQYEVYKYTTAARADCKPDVITVIDRGVGYEPLPLYTLQPDPDVDLVIDNSGTEPSVEDVLFIPPDPVTLVFADGGGKVTAGRIFIRTKTGTDQNSVLVTDGGEVSY